MSVIVCTSERVPLAPPNTVGCQWFVCKDHGHVIEVHSGREGCKDWWLSHQH